MSSSLEQLISIALDSSSDKKELPSKSKYSKVVLRFIRKYDIRPGKVRVPIYKIVYEFYKWQGAAYNEKCSATELGRQFTKHFDKTRSGKYRYYLLNECFNMDKKELKRAKDYYKKWRLKKPEDKELNTLT